MCDHCNEKSVITVKSIGKSYCGSCFFKMYPSSTFTIQDLDSETKTVEMTHENPIVLVNVRCDREYYIFFKSNLPYDIVECIDNNRYECLYFEELWEYKSEYYGTLDKRLQKLKRYTNFEKILIISRDNCLNNDYNSGLYGACIIRNLELIHLMINHGANHCRCGKSIEKHFNMIKLI